MPLSKKPSASTHRLDRSRRIRKKSDFAWLRKSSKKLVARHWILFFAKSQTGSCRLAITISGKYGNAVQRNRLRRLLRELFRLNQARIPGVDLHFIAKQKPAHLEFSRYKEELHEDFERMLTRIS